MPSPSGLHIVPTFDSSITTNPNAAAIESGINADISALQSLISTPLTVTITFESVNNGLGGSSTWVAAEPYSTFRSDLANQASPSSFDNAALQSLPATSTNPVNGQTSVRLSLPLLRATGEAGVPPDGNDSTISLNTPIMNLSRTGPQDPNKYDLQQVAMHEIVEVLGAGGGGSALSSGQVGSLDLFRYSATNTRSFTTNPNALAYFSINSGSTNRGYYNQDGIGDYADWDGDLNGKAQVQDAYSTPGIQLNLDANEKVALDVVGYHVANTK